MWGTIFDKGSFSNLTIVLKSFLHMCAFPNLLNLKTLGVLSFAALINDDKNCPPAPPVYTIGTMSAITL